MRLTKAQTRVLEAILRHPGETHGQLGRRLGIAGGTVRCHVQAMREALDAHNGIEMVIRALQLGLAQLPPGPQR